MAEILPVASGRPAGSLGLLLRRGRPAEDLLLQFGYKLLSNSLVLTVVAPDRGSFLLAPATLLRIGINLKTQHTRPNQVIGEDDLALAARPLSLVLLLGLFAIDYSHRRDA